MPTLGPIIIGVKNIDLALDFYINVFEIKVDSRSENYLSAYLSDTHIELEEDSPNRFPNWAKNNIGTYKNSEFIVEDINTFIAKVSKYGGRVVSKPKDTPWGSKITEIADIDGNIFLISSAKI
jgi:predicted enzyme related to lactoylglutathione lyase